MAPIATRSPALLAALALVAGCGASQSDGSGLLATGQSTAGITSAATGGLTGLQGQGSPFAGPRIDIVSPSRGDYLPAGPVQVEASVTQGGAKVAAVHVNGLAAPVAKDGTVLATVDLVPGLNTILVEAWDSQNFRSERHVSVLAGQFAPEAEAVAQAAAVRLTEGALDGFEPGIGSGIEAQRAAITAAVLGAKPPKDTKLEGFRFGAVDATLDAVPGGVRFTIAIDAVELDIAYRATILWVFHKTKRGTVRANRLTLEGTASVTLQGGALVTQVTQVTPTVAGFSVPDWADDHEADLRRAFTQAFAQQAARELDARLATLAQGTPTAGTVAQNVLGNALQVGWTLQAIAFDDDGATASFSGSVRAATPTHGLEDRTLVTRAPLATLGGAGNGAWNAALALHQDTLNQALHAAWRAGALSFSVDAATFAQLAPGAAPFDTTAILTAAPQLAAVLPAGLPLELEVEGQLPPVVALRAAGQGPGLLDLGLGGLRIKLFLIEASGQRTPLIEAIYSLRVPADVVERAGAIELEPAALPAVHVDVVGPALPGSEPVLEQLTATLAPQLLQAALGSLRGIAIPTIKGTSLSGVTFQTSGQTLVAAGAAVRASNP